MSSKILTKEIAEELIKENSKSLYIVTLDGSIFQTSGVAGFIGFNAENLAAFFESFFDSIPVDASNYVVSPVSDVESLNDLRPLFYDAEGHQNEYTKIFVAGKGIIEKDVLFPVQEEVIEKILERLKPLNDMSHFYTLLINKDVPYLENGAQPIFFNIEDAYSLQFRVDDSYVLDIGALPAAVFFSDIIPDFAYFSVYGDIVSGYELKIAIEKDFEDKCLPQRELFDFARGPIYVSISPEGSQMLMLQYYQQIILFSDESKLDAFAIDKDTSCVWDILKVDGEGLWDQILISDYIFLDGEHHCKVEDLRDVLI